VSTPVSAVGASTQATAAAQTTPKANALGQDAFMQLLITQLTHQDPTQPKEDTEFIAQLATFSQLEKLTSIASSITQLDTIAESMSRLEDKVSALEEAIKAASSGSSSTGATS
jgi:flagellar basal-body rod modification protein FlgD